MTESSPNKTTNIVKEDEPAPPGIDEASGTDNTKGAVKQTDIDFAIKAKSVPEEESEWTSLHHLQHCCSNDNEFNVDDVKGVNIVAKNVVFPFDELTNYQATMYKSNNSFGPFYTIGTLAYFMKCRGLKYSAYVKYVVQFLLL